MKSKRIVAAALMCALLLSCFAPPALAAAEVGDRRVAMAADLTAEERAQIFKDFGLQEGQIPEVIVTNADERAYLLNYIDESKIGTKALSCVYIEVLPAGQGLTVLTNNINYCTPEMYVNAMTTAGVMDARIIVSAPRPVSGTAALTGVYKAYESISGNSLSELAKYVGAEELVTTGQLAEYVGSAEATALIGELKGILDQTANMTDAEVQSQIDSIASQYHIVLTDGQKGQLLKLCRSLEKLDTNQLRERLVSLSEKVEKVGETSEKITQITESVKGFTQKVTGFFASIGGFFKNLFGAKG